MVKTLTTLALAALLAGCTVTTSKTCPHAGPVNFDCGRNSEAGARPAKAEPPTKPDKPSDPKGPSKGDKPGHGKGDHKGPAK